MKRTSVFSIAALLVAGMTPAMAQTVKVGGDIQVWYTQMMDSNLRNNSAASYYNLRSEFKENTFAIRRAEIKVSGNITDDIEFETMIDPSIATSSFDKTKPNASYNPMILQDAAITWHIGEGFDLKAGQFKNLQTMEGLTSSTEILFAERSQLGRVFGDKRDRGAALSYGFGDPKDFAGKVTVASFNGMNDLASGKANDTNAQKDFVMRAEFSYEKLHKFGVYTLQGATDQADKGKLTTETFKGDAAALPTTTDILDNKDKTTNVGAFYMFQNDSWIASVEYMTGLLGRRYGSVYDSANYTATKDAQGVDIPLAAGRQHLDQQFQGYYVTGGYILGNHTFLARYDVLNYNSGDKWYSATNPYKSATTDYTPKFTEITVGYTYAWKPEKVKAANFKLNYINRSKNFLKPNTAAGQTSEQGGDTIVAALQVAF